MIFRRIEIRGFRNLDAVELTPSPRSTVIVGPNGQGKTNFLEAVFFLATLKPLRASRLVELIRWGESVATVRAEVETRGAERKISVQVEEGTRRALLDGKPVRDLLEYFGGISVIAFTPDDLDAVKGSPEGRRRLIDRATFNRFPAYLVESRDYQRALRSRNRLLRAGASPGELDAFAEPLARLGARLISRRLSILGEFTPRVARAYRVISREESEVQVEYRASHLTMPVPAEEELVAMLREEIARRTARDVERGFTSVGPHVDDLWLSLNGHSARAFASQGQQRALVIALKIAEIENLQAACGVSPLLLLDDVSSELDPERNGQLMRYLAAAPTQVFLSTTDPRLVARAVGEDAKYYSVQAGSLRPAAAPSDLKTDK